MTGEAYTALGTVFAALFSALAAVYVKRRSDGAHEQTQTVQSRQITPHAQAQLNGLMVTVNNLSKLYAETASEMETLKRERDEDRRVISALARYASRLLAYIHAHVDRDDVPEQPEELSGLVPPSPMNRRREDRPFDGPDRRRHSR